jgi:hypothetical protein
MRERMDMDDGDDLEAQATVAVSAAPPDHAEFETRVSSLLFTNPGPTLHAGPSYL